MADQIFTSESLAQALKVTKRAVLRAIRSGDLQAAKVGPTWIIRGREVRAWLEALPSCDDDRRRGRE